MFVYQLPVLFPVSERAIQNSVEHSVDLFPVQPNPEEISLDIKTYIEVITRITRIQVKPNTVSDGASLKEHTICCPIKKLGCGHWD